MKNITKEEAVEIVLKKRFGITSPEDINEVLEVNVFKSIAEDESALGFGIELVIEGENNNTIKEEYQVNSNGVVYSWGNSPIIDNRSLNNPPINHQ